MTIENVFTTAAHAAVAAMVLVTVYVPAVLPEISTRPVAEFTKTRPTVELNVPAEPPKTGKGLEAFLQ